LDHHTVHGHGIAKIDVDCGAIPLVLQHPRLRPEAQVHERGAEVADRSWF
jgi:hypothetical protein